MSVEGDRLAGSGIDGLSSVGVEPVDPLFQG
jgi:hypothetical protein